MTSDTNAPLPSSATAWGAHLFTPANNAGFLAQLPLIAVRNVIIDLEYSTKLIEKHDGRLLASGAIRYLRELTEPSSLHVTVRVNMPRAWPLLAADLDNLVTSEPDALRIPAVESPGQVARISDYLDALERRHDVARPIALHPMIENPQGLARAGEIASASPRVSALAFGGEDWAHNCGASRSARGWELEYARHGIVAAAARAGVAAIDTVYNWLDDTRGFELDCRHSRGLGFHGRATINPRQIECINQVYAPSEKQRDWAKRLLTGLTRQTVDDTELLVSGGVILDPLAVTNARRILQHGRGDSDVG